jgi:hypothetical protein
MHAIFSFLLRLVLIAAGLLVALSLTVAGLLLLVLWLLRSAWARLTGQPVMPFVMRMDPRAGFGRVFRPNVDPRAGQVPSARPGHRETIPDVEDVEAKPPRQ